MVWSVRQWPLGQSLVLIGWKFCKYLYKLYKHSDRYVAYILSYGVSPCVVADRG